MLLQIQIGGNMDSKLICKKEVVELLYDAELDVGTEVEYEYEAVINGQTVKVKRYESALPAWIKNRAKRRRQNNG
jgi:hypothetical protein